MAVNIGSTVKEVLDEINNGTGGGGSCVITDLGEQEGHQPAEDTILELLKPSTVPTGKYLYTYWTSCNSDAVLAICYKNEWGIRATQITSQGQLRKFYYDFNEDSVIEQQCLTNMGVQLTDEFGDRSDVAISQWAVTEALKQVGGGLPFIQPTIWSSGSTYTPTKWTVASVGGVTTPTDGMTIAVRTANAGHDFGIALSIDAGNNFYPIVRNKDTRITKEYPKNSTLILTFNSTQTVNVYSGSSTTTTVTGCWQVADCDTDTIRQYHTTENNNYPLLFKYIEGNTSTYQANSYTRYSNNIYVNPSTGTIYANDFVVGGQSIHDRIPTSLYTENYSIQGGTEFDLEVYATDGMPLFFEIYVYQDVGYDQVPMLHLYNKAGDYFDIPSTYGSEYSIIIKPNGSNFDFYIRNIDGVISYLYAMSMGYIYLTSYSQAWSHDTEITVKYCWLNTIV